MSLRESRTLRGIAALTLLAGLAAPAEAQTFPNRGRSITIIGPLAAGGPTDIVTRVLAEKMSATLGVPVISEPRPGAGGQIAFEAVTRATPDGYTLLMGTSSIPLLPLNNKGFTGNIMKDIVPMTHFFTGATVFFVGAHVPAKTIQEFLAYAKANPGKMNYGSAAPSAMLSMEAFKARAGINLVHIPYKGSNPTTTALLGNEIQAAFDSAITYAAHVKSGKLKAIGVGGPRATALLPDVPLITDTFPGFATLFNGGLWAKTGTPKDIVDRLNREMNVIIQMPDIQALVASTGAYTPGGTSDDFRRIIESELEFYGGAAKLSGYKPE